MDFRQYDNAIGRFLGMDRLAELAYSITPYRFAYNNPVYYNDPTGLFESKDEAKKWAKENGKRTGWCSSNKIQQGENGTWAVNNKKDGSSHFAANAGDAEALGVNVGDVVAGALVEGNNKKSSDPLDVIIWGDDKAGNTRGRKGNATHSQATRRTITQ